MPNRLLLLPGIGADRRLFDEQRSCAAELHVIEWIPPVAADETLIEYAKRLARTIDTSHPFAIGGASFGGMVALELTRHIQPDTKEQPADGLLIARGRPRMAADALSSSFQKSRQQAATLSAKSSEHVVQHAFTSTPCMHHRYVPRGKCDGQRNRRRPWCYRRRGIIAHQPQDEQAGGPRVQKEDVLETPQHTRRSANIRSRCAPRD